MVIKITDSALHFEENAKYHDKIKVLHELLSKRYKVENTDYTNCFKVFVKGVGIYCRICSIDTHEYHKEYKMRVLIDSKVPSTWRERYSDKVTVREITQNNKTTLSIKKIYEAIENKAEFEYEAKLEHEKKERLREVTAMKNQAYYTSQVGQRVLHLNNIYYYNKNRYMRVCTQKNDEGGENVWVKLETDYRGLNIKLTPDNKKLLKDLDVLLKKLGGEKLEVK